MTETQQLHEIIPPHLAGMRLDQALAALFPGYSRARLQRWIKEGHVQVDGQAPRPKDVVFGGERVDLAVVLADETQWQPQALPLDIVYEDEAW
jgi:23S rRNA pseudouridine1911/1915/1917 synthase